MGGVATAIGLRSMGFDIEIFENNGQPGGSEGGSASHPRSLHLHALRRRDRGQPESKEPGRAARGPRGIGEEETLAAVAGEATSNAMSQAFANTVLACSIEPDLIETFMRNMKMDTHVFRYPTYEDLDEYIYGSAAVVGLMMHRGVGVTDVAANLHAEALGVAMQLTNFLRDVREE
jgi:phytoene synthase